MASYKSGFDPPTRPGETGRSRRMVTYVPPGTVKQEHREADIAHISGQMEVRRGMTRPQQTALPRPSMRDPSPSTRIKPEANQKGTTSKFGFGKAPVKAATVPELKGKSSRNVLRRKPSSIAQPTGARPNPERAGSTSPTKWSTERRPSIESSMKSAEAYNEVFTRARARVPVKETTQVYPELDRYRNRPENVLGSNRVITDLPHKLSTQDLPPPTPLMSGTPVYSSGGTSHHRYSGYSGSGYSASPSTRFSESPGPGAYSRDTTPTSMSSQSPGIMAPSKTTTPRLRQGSPAFTRPPLSSVTRRRAASIPNEVEAPTVDPHGLPSLRESLTSSSSNSTVKGEAKAKEKKKNRLPPLAPSPPPRGSSQKFKKPRSEEISPSKPSQAPAKPLMTSPLEPARRPTPQITAKSPPARPSREGAPDLQSQLGESMAVIQSNLAGISFSPDRRQSASARGAPSPLQGHRPQQASRLPSRNPSPSPVLPSPREATPAPSGLGIIPDLRPQQIPPSSRGTITRTPSPSVSNPKPRFGLFGRRTKTAPEITTIDTKTVRKGPTAGTGHEGYGRYGNRRSTSATGLGLGGRNRSISGASSSQESVASTRTHDPFLLERMSPVIIAGGGEILENRNTSSELARTESNTSLLLGRPSVDSKVSSNLGHEISRTTLWPSALPRDAPRRGSLAIPKGRRPSDSSDDGVGKSSLAFRRSILSNSTGALHLPRPLKISGGVSPSMTSLDASIMSDESQFDPKDDRGRKGQLTKPKKLEKRQKEPGKWNFFHRSKPTPKEQAQPALQVTVGKPVAKAVPHYAMIDSSDEHQEADLGDLEDILNEVEVVDLSNEELDALQFGNYKDNLRRIENLKSNVVYPKEKDPYTPPALFSSPEPMQSPEPLKTDLHLVKENAPVRPSRLPQVGRIPKVISARPETTSPKSFSRPFARLSTLQPLLTPGVLDTQSVALGPSPPRPSTPELVADPTRQSSADSKAETTSTHSFLAFSPRKNSEATTSSSGSQSVAEVTAVVPEPGAALVEDEVWDEYDDLIENDDGMKPPVSATSSHGVPFQYESYESRRMRKSKVAAKESPTLTSTPVIKPDAERHSILTSSSIYSIDMGARLKDALNTIPSPTTPMSFTDFISGYGDRNNGSAQKRRSSNASGSRQSTSSSNTKSISSMLTISEQDNSSPISQVNLRVGSMTVSKWLTFGHVLFSPARDEIMEGTKHHSILVIDGLGNDDWSFYAAETYPSATFYNLSPTLPLPASSTKDIDPNAFPLTPPNHVQIPYPSLHSLASSQSSPPKRFPFPTSTFSIVIFRFPPALQPNIYNHIISESKRVLKPNGYLEMAILDLDMLNMGNRARRAVRGLKVRMQVAVPGVSVGSASDLCLRALGRKGMKDVKSCKVGVPVASTVSAKNETQGKEKIGRKEVREERSLVDMMKDPTPAGDESITKMVARVGRWWYTRCYEDAVLPSSSTLSAEGKNATHQIAKQTTPSAAIEEESIFSNAKLLREAEKWNSSFKLVVAYAQKPSARGRGASV